VEEKMDKKYVIWWHSYVEEINRDATTIKDISDSVVFFEVIGLFINNKIVRINIVISIFL